MADYVTLALVFAAIFGIVHLARKKGWLPEMSGG